MKYVAIKRFDDGSKGKGYDYEVGDAYLGKDGEKLHKAGLVIPEKDFGLLKKAEIVAEKLEQPQVEEPQEVEAEEEQPQVETEEEDAKEAE